MSSTNAQSNSPISQNVTETFEIKEDTEAEKKESAKNLLEIKSPMIGTFYRSPNPESPPFIEPGDRIKPGQTICIIEAMKLFNEIEAEISGTIVEILIDNATPVEFDQPLYLVDPL
jgi:acetyl-CoA carboxylase biotin carboxyl carrier protein